MKPKPVTGFASVYPEDPDQLPAHAYFVPPKKYHCETEWVVIWKNSSDIGVSLVEQATSVEMTLSDYRVRDFLIGTIGIGNYVFVNQAEVARQLNINRVTVCESIKRLCSIGLLLKGPKSGRSNTYMVNPAFCFFGGLGDGVKARREVIKQGKAKIFNFHPNVSDDD